MIGILPITSRCNSAPRNAVEHKTVKRHTKKCHDQPTRCHDSVKTTKHGDNRSDEVKAARPEQVWGGVLQQISLGQVYAIDTYATIRGDVLVKTHCAPHSLASLTVRVRETSASTRAPAISKLRQTSRTGKDLHAMRAQETFASVLLASAYSQPLKATPSLSPWKTFAMDLIRRNQLQMAVRVMVKLSGYFRPSKASDSGSGPCPEICCRWSVLVASQEVRNEVLLKPVNTKTGQVQGPAVVEGGAGPSAQGRRYHTALWHCDGPTFLQEWN